MHLIKMFFFLICLRNSKLMIIKYLMQTRGKIVYLSKKKACRRKRKFAAVKVFPFHY